MPRDGSGIYSKPANTTATANTTIESAAYNTLMDDVAADLNTARPVTSGGTGATNATDARKNLGAAVKPVFETVSANRTVVAADDGKTLICTAAVIITLTAAVTLGDQFAITIHANGGNVTIDPNGSETIDGGSTLAIPTGVSAEIITDGTSWYVAALSGEPVGRMSEWMTETVPPGYLEANGANVSRTDYPRLFAVYGTRYGAGDGSTTFGLPDMRGRFPRGWANGGSSDPDRASRLDRGDGTTGDNVGTLQGHAYDQHNHSASMGSAGSHSHSAGTSSAGSHSHSAGTSSAGNHSHSAGTSSAGNHSHVVYNYVDNLAPHRTAAQYGSLTGGELQVVTKTTGNAGSHTHGVTVNSSGSHTHGVTVNSSGSHTHGVTVNSSGSHTHVVTVNSGGAHTHSVTVNNSGGNETRPINVAVMFIIKT